MDSEHAASRTSYPWPAIAASLTGGLDSELARNVSFFNLPNVLSEIADSPDNVFFEHDSLEAHVLPMSESTILAHETVSHVPSQWNSEDKAASVLNEVPPAVRTAISEHTELKCPHKDCSYTGTFLRQYELDRHVKVKHECDQHFTCPYPGCFKGNAAPKFARSDKLTSHIKNVHGGESQAKILLKCPVDGCVSPAMELILLGAHIQQARRSHHGHASRGDARAIANAASPAHRQCPIWSCRRVVPLASLPEHLLSHSQDEVYAAAPILAEENYIVIRDQCAHATARGSCSCRVVEIQIGCPLCHLPCKNHAEFATHLDRAHLISGNQRTHFDAWHQQA